MMALTVARTSGPAAAAGLGVAARAVRRRFPGGDLPLEVVGQFDDGVEVAQFEILGHFETEVLGDFAEDFHLFDGVDAEVGFQVEFVFEHVGGVAGLLGDDGFDRGQDIGACCGSRAGRRRAGCAAGVSPAGICRWR